MLVLAILRIQMSFKPGWSFLNMFWMFTWWYRAEETSPSLPCYTVAVGMNLHLSTWEFCFQVVFPFRISKHNHIVGLTVTFERRVKKKKKKWKTCAEYMDETSRTLSATGVKWLETKKQLSSWSWEKDQQTKQVWHDGKEKNCLRENSLRFSRVFHNQSVRKAGDLDEETLCIFYCEHTHTDSCIYALFTKHIP